MVSLANVKARVAALCGLACVSACTAHGSLPAPQTAGPAEPTSAAEGPRPPKNRPETTSSASEAPLDDSGDNEGEAEAEAESSDEHAESEPTSEPVAGATRPHPLDGWSDAKIEDAVATNLASLGPMSVGTPNAGALVNGVQAKASELYSLVSPGEAWGTQETIDYLDTAVRAVQDEFPNTPPLALGDIGARHGGHLKPHISHQAGRDLDISFYYRDGTKWYARGTRENLDFPRLWAFIRAIIAKTDIDLILLDQGLQGPLKEYALSIGEDPEWVAQVFPGKGSVRPIIRHAPGHDTHLHLRFFNPIAQETARRAYPALVQHKIVSAPEQYVLHKAKKNETLGMIAKKYGSSVRAIREANGLRSNLIHDQVSYRVPVTGGVRILRTERVRIPARRVPPPRQDPAQPDPSRQSRSSARD